MRSIELFSAGLLSAVAVMASLFGAFTVYYQRKQLIENFDKMCKDFDKINELHTLTGASFTIIKNIETHTKYTLDEAIEWVKKGGNINDLFE